MTIKLDLRPETLKRESKKAVNATRLVAAVLLVAFCLVSLGSILYGTALAFRLREEKASLKLSIEELTTQDIRLTGELKRLQNESATFTDNLALINAELPALEFLNAIRGLFLPRRESTLSKCRTDRQSLSASPHPKAKSSPSRES